MSSAYAVEHLRLEAGFQWRMERLLGLQSPFVRWWNESILEFGLQAGKGIDVILGELVPYETAFSVERVARSLGVPGWRISRIRGRWTRCGSTHPRYTD